MKPYVFEYLMGASRNVIKYTPENAGLAVFIWANEPIAKIAGMSNEKMKNEDWKKITPDEASKYLDNLTQIVMERGLSLEDDDPDHIAYGEIEVWLLEDGHELYLGGCSTAKEAYRVASAYSGHLKFVDNRKN